jgi:hypothetical protein
MKYIYADFNNIGKCYSDPAFDCLDLNGYGTLLSLNSQKILLREGDKYIFFEANDIEVEGEVYFERNISSIFSNSGKWFAKISREEIRETKEILLTDKFPCFNCGFDMNPTLIEKGRNFNEKCPHCATPITFALSDPLF